MSQIVSVSTEGMEWISFRSLGRERSKLPTGRSTRSEMLLGFAPSPLHPAAMESDMALGFTHPAYMENDLSDLMEEDVWGDESSLYAEEDMAPGFHSSHNKRSPGSERDSVFSASLDTGSIGSSCSRATGSFSPLGFSAAMMNNWEANSGQLSTDSHIMPHSIASGGINNTMSTSPAHGITSSHMSILPGGKILSTSPGCSIMTSHMSTVPGYGNIMGTSPGHGIMSSHMSILPGYGPRSAPVKVPLWSKLCSMKEHIENDLDDGDDGEERLPPHELLAKQHAGSQISAFSVIEGAGRTLKGRDVSKVRDAVWKQTGFFG